ncbi:hypothetical protein PCANC_06457 [Puccinia coronata f. sp. avenae]|uniref:Major facilitator superfamily (MFS) profile domain-containing protein n=1 Tax=Puccinia coronata f. sp. avenae TaxID=200324 RepID=A0A2N5VVZ9_9BASI|nr:hypothetical protein PCASD_11998 [Puccinia coronata f. sp. avenae]PLW54146.1 hypothetical protein PCANC_06457 [Puccinia coronata f. sp. avenae]
MILDKKDSGSANDPTNQYAPISTDAAASSSGNHVLLPSDEDDQTLKHKKNDERKAILKLDLIVLPLIVVFYFFSSLDRSNIGNARVAGLQKSLKLSDHQYSVALTSTFITYVLVKVPANLILKRVGAHIFLPLISGAWGLVTFCQGFTTNFGGLVTARLFMGLAEGGLYPAILLYLSNSYSRDQLQMRIAIFYSSASLSGSFSGLLAYAILHMHETWGKPAWAWLFFIEGLATMVFAAMAAFIFPSSISSNRLLSGREKDILLNRLIRKAPSTVDPNEKFKVSEVLAAIKSPHVIILTITQFMSGTAAYSVTYFTPTIVHSLGYTPSHTQLMTSPPFAVAFVVMLAGGYFSDRCHARALTAGVSAAVAFTGFMLFLLLDPSRTHAKYGSLFLAIPGVFSLIPPIGAWAANNSDGHYRRATAIAFSYSTSTVGGILSTWLFPQSQGPRYRPGIIVNLVCCAGILLGVSLNYMWLRYANHYKSNNRSKILEPYDPHGHGLTPGSPEFLRAWAELGDRHPDFKYVY